MELTTKDLFELAEIHWSETNPITTPWDRVSPMDQARQAEAIKAVIAEYEKIRVNDYLSTIPIKDSWDNWEDVPVGVIVEGHGPSTTSKDGTKHNKFRKRADGGGDFWATLFSPGDRSGKLNSDPNLRGELTLVHVPTEEPRDGE